MSAKTLAAAFALLALIIVSCGDDGSNFVPFQPPPDTTETSSAFAGFLADGNQGALLEITISSASLAPAASGSRAPHAPSPTVTAVGFLRWPGGDISLTGVYDVTADTLYLAGSGRELRGNIEEIGTVGILTGSATTPSGAAGFMAIHDSDTTKVARAWVGTFQATPTAESGTLCFLQSNFSVMGQAFNDGAAAPMPIAGTIFSGAAGDSIAFGDPSSGYDFGAQGGVNLLTGSASGYYTLDVTDPDYGTSSSGFWSATRR